MLVKSIRRHQISVLVTLIFIFQYTCVLAQESSKVEIPRDSLLTVARSIIDSTTYCILATVDSTGSPRLRPMEPFSPDSDMTIWLGTNRYSRKVNEIKNNPTVTLTYLSPDNLGYVSVYGTAELINDQTAKEYWWKPKWSAFYLDKNDMYLLIKVTPVRIELIDYLYGVSGDSKTWTPAIINF